MTTLPLPLPESVLARVGKDSATKVVFGIDLGTTNSCIARLDTFGRPEIIANRDGALTTASAVLFEQDNSVTVGALARRQIKVRPEDVATLVKRHIGDEGWRFSVNDKDWSAAAVSAQILRALAHDAHEVTGTAVRDVVITVPAYFGDAERRATKLAGALAGLNVIDIVNEPTAAALSYGFGLEDAVGREELRHVVVYDLGGGTFDVAVLAIEGTSLRVVATDGDHNLGGADIDERLASYLATKFTDQAPTAADPFDDTYATADLLISAEETKQALSSRGSVDVLVAHDGQRVTITVTRDTLEGLCAGMVERTIALTRSVLAEAELRGATHIDAVLLVGGSSRMPVVARRLAQVIDAPAKLHDPDLAIAKGAALYGQRKALVTAAQVAAAQERAAGTDDVDVVTAIAASFGLATDAVRGLLATQLTNVTSRGFGILVEHPDGSGCQAQYLAHRNDALPITVERSFFTVVDDQTAVRVQVIEQDSAAESVNRDDVKVIVEGQLSQIPIGWPRGTPVQVLFTMAEDQTVTVTARHPAVTTALTLVIDKDFRSGSEDPGTALMGTVLR